MRIEKLHLLKQLIGYDMDLGETSIADACFRYRELFQVYPTTLFVSLTLVDEAYSVMTNACIQRMVIVPIPGMPADSWGVCGGEGIIISGGAV